ncbi:MAG: hypothetical protein MJ131_08205 [Lachnospiraceae bacterium]|nr:hypothetical protein [Lachnospiraceae bacterium]
MQNPRKYSIDNRKKEDLIAELSELAHSYAPEWKFDPENPDIGSVLALLFADQLYGNINRFNQVIDRYHTEFVNLLDISLHKAHPASAICLFKLTGDNVPDVYVEKRTRLLADNGENSCVFETSFPVYLTSAKLKSVFQTNSKEGKIIHEFGDYKMTDYNGKALVSENSDNEALSTDSFMPFTLYDFSEGNVARQAIILYHSRIFDVEGENILCRIKGNPDFRKRLEDGEYRILYYTDNGFVPVDSVRALDDENFLIRKKEENKKVEVDGHQVSMLAIEAVKPQLENRSFDSIQFSSSGGERRPDFAGSGSEDYEVERFSLFGDTLSNYEECYIGMDSYFGQKGSKISLSFNVAYDEHYLGYVQTTEEEELKIIKRKERVKVESKIAYAFPQEISIEYYNGTGWKRLKAQQEYTKIFAEAAAGSIELSFICPSDWEPASVGAYNGRCLKIQLRRSDNCYLQPCIHMCPVISDMQIRYTYEGHYELPEYGKKFFGTSNADITADIIAGKSFVGFEKINYSDTALYLGFDRCFENGPVSLWWKLDSIKRNKDKKLHFYYSSSKGFKEMAMVDYTRNFSKTGVMLFLPPEDMVKTELEGMNLCWIKVVQEGEPDMRDSIRIIDIQTNGIEATNICTHEPTHFYIDEVKSDMVFTLPHSDIYDAEVWVNERNELSIDAMKQMLRERPDECQANYNYLGNISEFFVKWTEKDNFNNSNASDRHYVLDRTNNLLIFGDGINVRIPQNTSDTGFIVKCRTCDGSKGNVPAGAINMSDRNLLYVGEISNPDPAYGGSSMETRSRALARGADLISSGGRFVTERDYLNEITNYSENINKAAIVIGVDRFGVRCPDMVYVVLLMSDYKNGPTSFYQMQTELRRHLLEHCEMTIVPEELQIEEPVFVELSVDVWAQIVNIEDSFEVQNLVSSTLNEYLDPISYEKHKGWPIGELPGKTQILIRLNALKSKAIIRQIVVTARYSDSEGFHEVDLDMVKATPFMVVSNGTHKVHISRTGEVI